MRCAQARTTTGVTPTVTVDVGGHVLGVGIPQGRVSTLRRGYCCIGHRWREEGRQLQGTRKSRGRGTAVTHIGKHVDDDGVLHRVTDGAVHQFADKRRAHLGYSLVVALLQQDAARRTHLEHPITKRAILACTALEALRGTVVLRQECIVGSAGGHRGIQHRGAGGCVQRHTSLERQQGQVAGRRVNNSHHGGLAR